MCKACGFGRLVNAGRVGEHRNDKECTNCGAYFHKGKVGGYGGYGS